MRKLKFAVRKLKKSIRKIGFPNEESARRMWLTSQDQRESLNNQSPAIDCWALILSFRHSNVNATCDGNARCLAGSTLHFYFDSLSLILFQYAPAYQSLFLFIP
jgi:hypothetical protein